jgi:molybdenum cofactor biosynthesis protein B
MTRKATGNPVEEHRKQARQRAAVALITLSTTRTAAQDKSGDVIREQLEAGGHTVAVRRLIPDSRAALRSALRSVLRRDDVSAVITTGGTGLAASDVTVETVRPMLDKELTGFNALFMQLSYPEAGAACMLSRALAGTIKGRPIFCLPGSTRACRLAMEKLVIPELPHILFIAGAP